MEYTTFEMAKLHKYYSDKVVTDPSTRYTMRIGSFIQWLHEEDRTLLIEQPTTKPDQEL